MRIAFAGTPEFAKIQLEALLATSHELVVVYTQPDKPVGRGQVLQESPVKQVALKHQIPVEQPFTLKSPDAVNILARHHVDVFIVAAYGMLLPDDILRVPRYGCLNVHASLLPRWRGASPIQQAILAGDQKTGITLMQMDKGLDTGAILAQDTCDITHDDTSATLHDKLAQLGAKLLIQQLDNVGQLLPQLQDNALATHAGKIRKEDAHLQWHQTAVQLERQIRAFTPWPIAFTQVNDQLIRIWHAKVISFPNNKSPGTIVSHTPEGIIVNTGKDALLITHAQLPSKKMLPFSEIIKGHSTLFAIGQQLT